MVALRERTSRPSYASLAGLEHLSDEDEDEDEDEEAEDGATGDGITGEAKLGESDNTGSGSGSGSEDGDSGLSSGNSSAFDPKAESSAPKSKTKPKSRSKSKSGAKGDKLFLSSESGSDSAYASGQDDEDEDEDEDEEEALPNGGGEGEADDDDDLDLDIHAVDENATVHGDGDGDGDDILVEVESDGPEAKPRKSKSGSRVRPRVPFFGSGAAYVVPLAQPLPTAYRALLKSHSQSIVVASPSEARISRDNRGRNLELESMAYGPGTVYKTRLKKEVRGREQGDVQVVWDDEGLNWEQRKLKRLQRAVECLRGVLLTIPWQAWEGDVWWPEMCRPKADDKVVGEASGSRTEGPEEGVVGQAAPGGSGKKEFEWCGRNEVRLGLDHVGRSPMDQMSFLSEQDADTFLPTLIDKHGRQYLSCYVGPHGHQTKLDYGIYSSHRTSDYSPTKAGFTFCAGGPIWGLDWCPYPEDLSAAFDSAQYLAVSTMPHIDTRPALGEKWPSNTPGSIQIWSAIPPAVDANGAEVEGGSMRCELVLCVDGGPVWDLKWMPMGAWDPLDIEAKVPKLGILAAVQLDGSISLYAVPQPTLLRRHADSFTGPGRPVYLRLKDPLLKLEVADATCTCLQWLTGSSIIAGLSNGSIIAWDVLEALRTGQSGPVLPSSYFSACQSSINALTVGRVAPGDERGEPRYDQEPMYVVVGSNDGAATMVDLRDPQYGITMMSTRVPVTAVGWSHQICAPMYSDIENVTHLYRYSRANWVKNQAVDAHRGPTWAIGTSDFHTMVLTASSDGSLLLSNVQNGWFRRRGEGLLYHRLFELDYDQHTEEYRLTDDFLPEELPLEYAVQKNMAASHRKKPGAPTGSDPLKHSLDGNPAVFKSGNWSPHVGVHRVVWNNGSLARGGWLAAGTGSGLGRVEIIHGRFHKGVVPAAFQ